MIVVFRRVIGTGSDMKNQHVMGCNNNTCGNGIGPVKQGGYPEFED
jgi:hypothetical protein